MLFLPGCGCCEGTPPPTGSICVVTTGCNGAILVGATVTVTGPGTITGSPCETSGEVASVTRTATGSGYTSPPTVGFSGGAGSGAAATAVIGGGSLTSLTKTASGSGYTAQPNVVFSYGNASATARLTATTLASVTINSGGSGYVTPTATVLGGGGSGATVTLTVTSGVITAVNVTNAGTGYTFTPAIFITPTGGGSGGSLTAVLTATTLGTLTLGFAGNNYTYVSGTPTVSLTGGGGSGATATAAIQAQCCVTITAGGDYTITVDPPSGITGYDTRVVVHTGLTVSNFGFTQQLFPSTGYTCTVPTCCPYSTYDQNVPFPDTYAIPDTLYLDDGIGIVTLTRSLVLPKRWEGCATRPSSRGAVATDCSMDASDVYVFFLADCVSLDRWEVIMSVGVCQSVFHGPYRAIDAEFCGGPSGDSDFAKSTGTVDLDTCNPVSRVFTVDSTGIGIPGEGILSIYSLPFTASLTE